MEGDVPVADLHVHTTVSDGTLTIPELPAAARAGGVSSVAVTDHDRLHPELGAPVTTVDGVTVIRGVELRVDAGDQHLDLLGYAAEPTDELTAELDRLQRDRVERAREIVSRVEDRLDVSLDVNFEAGVGRPHIARAIDASDADVDFAGAFRDLIGDGGPCYVARAVPSFERGVELLSAACAVVGLAHPLRYADPESALDRARRLDAVERYYPYGREVTPGEAAAVDRVIDERELLAAGGTDAHEKALGVAGPPASAYERFAARLPRAEA
jgi:predicted metal-dependent phosphoesterase TrpH